MNVSADGKTATLSVMDNCCAWETATATIVKVRFSTEILDDFRRFADEIWRSYFGQDTICDFPFGCQNCECEPDGTDEAGRISAAGCPAEELTPTAANPDQPWWPGLRQIPQTVKHDRLPVDSSHRR